jgi:hypothetical protein
MSLYSFQETLVASQVAGAAKTGTAAATILDASSVITLPAQYWQVGRSMRIKAFGQISCVVTTPGTCRFDVRLGGTVVWDSQAINLNIVAKVNVGWTLEVVLTCRTIGSGTAATLAGQGTFMSEAVIGSPLPTVGGSGHRHAALQRGHRCRAGLQLHGGCNAGPVPYADGRDGLDQRAAIHG